MKLNPGGMPSQLTEVTHKKYNSRELLLTFKCQWAILLSIQSAVIEFVVKCRITLTFDIFIAVSELYSGIMRN